MRHRFIGWGIVVAILLGGSTIVGIGLRAMVRPIPPNYQQMWARPVAPARVDATTRTLTAFPPPTPADEQTSEELGRVIQSVCNLRDFARPQDWVRSFDTLRMADEEVALGYYQFRHIEPDRGRVLTAEGEIRTGLQELARRQSPFLPGGVVTVDRVGLSANMREALVIAKHTTTDDRGRPSVQYIRWWMSRENGPWRVYDFDYPATRLRYLAAREYINPPTSDDDVPGRDFGGSPMERPMFDRFLYAVNWMTIAGTANDRPTEYASGWNDPIEQIGMLKYTQGARAAARVRLSVLQGNLRFAQQYLDYAKQQMPNAAYILTAEAMLLNAQKQHEQAISKIQLYRESVGDDPFTVVEDAKAQAGRANDPAVAIRVLRRGLEKFPGDRTLFLELARRVPREDREALGTLMAKTGGVSLIQDAATVFEQQFPSTLDGLCTGYLREEPNNLSVLSRAIHVKIALGQLKAAGQLLKKVPAAERPSILDSLAIKAGLATSAVDYYTAVAEMGDGEAFFFRLAPFFLTNLVFANPKPADHQKRRENFSAVVSAHRDKHPASASLHLGEAMLLGANNDFAKADAELAKALAKLPKPTRTERIRTYSANTRDERTWEQVRSLRAYCLVRQGKWKVAYAELAPAVDTFDQLAAQMMVDQDEFKIAELCDLHAKAVPHDVELIFWRGEVQFLKKDNEAAIKLFQEYREKGGRDARQKFRAEERLVRACVRLNRIADARQILDEVANGSPFAPFLVALLASEEGDAESVMAQFDTTPVAPIYWYNDPDLGPRMKKPEFAAVRQKYPPPVR